MRYFTLGACSSGRLMKPTTISTSCRSGKPFPAVQELTLLLNRSHPGSRVRLLLH
jgi:hypothetical protein